MKKLLFSLLLCLSLSAGADSPPSPSFELDAVPLADLVRLVYVQAYPSVPYFVDPVILQDRRPVSFRYAPRDGEFRSFFGMFLRSLGYSLEAKGKADVIRPLPAESKLPIVEDTSFEVFLYKPRYRDSSYLIEMLSPLFSGKFTNQRAMNIQAPKNPVGVTAPSGVAVQAQPVNTLASPGSLLDQTTRKNDQLIFAGSLKEVAALKKLLQDVDIDPGQVVVQAVLYEVQTSEHEGSALQVAANLLGGKLQFNLGAAQLADNFMSFKNSTVSLIMQALDSDSRFKVLSSPSVRVASGESASLNVGDQVPVLGAITYPQGSVSPVQSVDYRPSGVLFSVSPQIRDSVISLRVDQQVSSFVQTTTGVNNSPTLTTRQLSTSLNMADGDVIVIGGLRQDKDSRSASGLDFLPAVFKSQSADRSHSEIILFLQLRRV